MDCKRGSKTYKKALKYDRSNVVFKRPQELNIPQKKGSHPNSWGWFCDFKTGNGIVPGFGMTKDDAFVDFVEEGWCLTGEFPKGYPN